jgi:hypothetical protein
MNNQLETEITIIDLQGDNTELSIYGIKKMTFRINVKLACNEDYEQFICLQKYLNFHSNECLL